LRVNSENGSAGFPIITIFFYRLVSVLAIYNLLAKARKHSLATLRFAA